MESNDRVAEMRSTKNTSPELVLKIKKCGNESTLSNRILTHNCGGLGADTCTDILYKRVGFTVTLLFLVVTISKRVDSF